MRIDNIADLPPKYRDQATRQLARQNQQLIRIVGQEGGEAVTAQAEPVRRNKYGNIKTEIDGIKFDSKREAARWSELRQLETLGSITNLRRQVPLRIDVNGQHICKYQPDFVYFENGKEVTEDLKSPASITPVYKLKKRLVQAVLGITIRETK